MDDVMEIIVKGIKRSCIIIVFSFFTVLSLIAQTNYSDCYKSNMAQGNTAFNQGRYTEAKNYYAKARICTGGNPTEAQKKINACDAQIKAQLEAAEERRRATEKAAEEKKRTEAAAEAAKRKAEEDAIEARKKTEEAAERENQAEKQRRLQEMRKKEENNCEFLTDVDGNRYRLVQLGSQCWMAENLRTTHYADGYPLSLGGSNNGSCWYCYFYPNNDRGNVKDYGCLYDRNSALRGKDKRDGEQGICPYGWHVPSAMEWRELFNYVSNQSQYRCADDKNKISKALSSKQGWTGFFCDCGLCMIGDVPGANNATGFNAMPAGAYSRHNRFERFGDTSYIWSSSLTEKKVWSENIPLVFEFQCDEATIQRSDGEHTYMYGDGAFSVRCVRD